MPADDSVDQLERELETVERSMSAVGGLSAQQAERVAERVDRLASQLLAITMPEPWDEVHARLGTTPASGEDFSALMGEVGSPAAFGPRRPRPGVRTVYERAHRRLHGRFP